MGFTTVAAFVDGLTGLTWTGITRVYREPPDLINSTDVPCLFPRIPTGNSSSVTLSSATGLRHATVELVCVVNAASLSTSAVKFDEELALIDNMHAVIASNAATLGIDDWDIQSVQLDDGSWALVATVEASG